MWTLITAAFVVGGVLGIVVMFSTLVEVMRFWDGDLGD